MRKDSFMTPLEEALESVKDGLLSDIMKILEIPSLKKEPLPGAPFGSEVARAFETALSIGKKLGLKAFSKDGHYIYFEIGEKGPLGAVLCHLDVVPAESGWIHPPFKGTVADGKMFGRGVEDNKGPAVCSLYALHCIQKTSGIKGRLRVILGGDEESGWECVDKYKQNEEIPAWGLTPDSQFPVIFAEKNIARISLTAPFRSDSLYSVSGGKAVNMVPEKATAVFQDTFPENEIRKIVADRFEDSISLTKENGRIIASVKGKSAHASVPDKGINAISVLFAFLGSLMPKNDLFRHFVDFYNSKFQDDHWGEKLGVALEDDVSGKLTINPGVLETKNGHVTLFNDIRCPIKYSAEEIIGLFNKIEFPELRINLEKFVDGLYVPENSVLIATVLETYRKITGDDTPPVAIGGGTYARAFDNTVAFGPVFPWRENMAHQPDEYMHTEDIFLFTRILAESLCELDRKFAGEEK
ncbi:Sapep family Mn(2+)-dependent dipeptidase [candidate division WOR-3 bacterium]|nr:Sapep family Mn(2+)-dependent dipeptidase [candidate division WOR-3 bacterium]